MLEKFPDAGQKANFYLMKHIFIILFALMSFRLSGQERIQTRFEKVIAYDYCMCPELRSKSDPVGLYLEAT